MSLGNLGGSTFKQLQITYMIHSYIPTPGFLGFLVAQLVKNLPAMQETWARSLGWEDPWRRERLPTPVFWPGEFRGQYSPWNLKESDTTE